MGGEGGRWVVSYGCRGPQTIFSPRRFPLLSKSTAHTVDWCPSSVAKEHLEGEGVGVEEGRGEYNADGVLSPNKALRNAMHANSGEVQFAPALRSLTSHHHPP